MSQPDLARMLHDARPVAPPELRERVRLVAAQAAPSRRQLFTWRRALVVGVPVAIAVAAGVLATRPTEHQAQPTESGYRKSIGAAVAQTDHAFAAKTPVAPSATRVQRYSTSLELRVRDAADLSAASKRAVAIAHGLGGYEQRVNVETARASGSGESVLRIPTAHVQAAVRRLTALRPVLSRYVPVE